MSPDVLAEVSSDHLRRSRARELVTQSLKQYRSTGIAASVELVESPYEVCRGIRTEPASPLVTGKVPIDHASSVEKCIVEIEEHGFDHPSYLNPSVAWMRSARRVGTASSQDFFFDFRRGRA